MTRLSSRHLDRLLLSLRSKPPPTTTSTSISGNLSCDPSPPPPAPLLLAAAAGGGGGKPPCPLFLQSLAVLLVSGESSHPHAATRLLNSVLRVLLSRHRHRLAAAFLRRHQRFLPFDQLTFPLLAALSSSLPSSAPAVHSLAVRSGLSADVTISNCFLTMYSSLGDLAAARKLFDEVPHRDLVSDNSMLHAYAKHGMVDAARNQFDEMPIRDLITWNTMLNCYVKNGTMSAARSLFDEMPQRDVVSWNAMLTGYARTGDTVSAEALFVAMPERDVVSWNAMLDGYTKAGDVVAARRIFDAMPRKSVVSWNVMLALYARVKDFRQVSWLFDGMTAVGNATPNEATFVSVLTACANLGDLERGRWVHSLIRDRHRCIKLDVLLATALLTMYAKCGVMEAAREIFDSMEDPSVASWNSLIIGYGLHGQSEKALELFLEMEKSGPRPNETTFVCILSSCAHAGMVLEGWWCFDRMARFYGVEPKVEHFGCMMDLLGRAGLLKDSEDLAKSLQGKVSPALWGALMSASSNQRNLKLGEFVGKKLIETKPMEVGPYVLLSNIYAAGGRWGDVEKVREMMERNGLEKDVGRSQVGTEEPGSRVAMEESMVLSMLGDMGAHLKLPSMRLQERERSLASVA